MPKASKTAAASRSRRSRLNLAIAVAEVSLDRNLFASPGGEAELAIDPVASMESVVREVSLIYWSAIRQSDGRRNEDVPVAGGVKCRRNKRHWPADNAGRVDR